MADLVEPELVVKEEEDEVEMSEGGPEEGQSLAATFSVDKKVIDDLVNELEDPEVPLNDFSRIDFRKKEKGFHCKLCRKSFDRLNTLKRHLVTHIGARYNN